MEMTPDKTSAESAHRNSVGVEPADIEATSIVNTLARLRVNAEVGLTEAEVNDRRKEYGYNEVAERRGHPVVRFLRKFWGISAWMLELIMALSVVLRKYSDLVVVGTQLLSTPYWGFCRSVGPPVSLRRCDDSCRSTHASCASRIGASDRPGSWSPGTSFACERATLSRRI